MSEVIYLSQSAGSSVIDDSARQGTALNRATAQRGVMRKTQGGSRVVSWEDPGSSR